MERKPQSQLERLLCGIGVVLLLTADLTRTGFDKPLRYTGWPIMLAGLGMLIYRNRDRLS